MPYPAFYSDIYGDVVGTTIGGCRFHDTYSDFYCTDLNPIPFRGLQILARAPDLTIIGEIEYTRAELILRYNAVGSWALEVGFDGNLNSPAGTLLTPGAGIVAVANGRVILSGPVTKPVRRADGDLNRLAIGGVDDLQVVADRDAHQDPGHADFLQTDNTYTTADDGRGGVAETVIKQFVNVNAGPAAVTDRPVQGLVIDIDRALGSTVQGVARMQNLLELITDLGTAGGVGFAVIQTSRTDRTFAVYEPADKTRSVVFSTGLANVQSYEYSSERPAGNVIYAGGDGEGASRKFRVGRDEDSIDGWGRIEGFIEDSSSDMTKLDQSLSNALAESAARFSLSAQAVDTGTHEWAPLATSPQVETYDLGDQVSVYVDGQQISEVIRELHVVHSPDGMSINPVIGSTGQRGSPDQRFFEAVAKEITSLRNQVRDLQRR